MCWYSKNLASWRLAFYPHQITIYCCSLTQGFRSPPHLQGLSQHCVDFIPSHAENFYGFPYFLTVGVPNQTDGEINRSTSAREVTKSETQARVCAVGGLKFHSQDQIISKHINHRAPRLSVERAPAERITVGDLIVITSIRRPAENYWSLFLLPSDETRICSHPYTKKRRTGNGTAENLIRQPINQAKRRECGGIINK